MKFKTSAATNEFIESFYQRAGARNKAVLGRAGLFLALGAGVPPEFRPADAKGVDLDDETVLGEDLRDVVRIALHHRVGRALDEEGYRQEFRRYFEYGCGRLALTWEDCGRDQARFVGELLRICGTPPMGDDSSQDRDERGKKIDAMAVVPHEVKLRLLTDADEWTVNRAGGNGLLVISGQPGMGKSQLALDLLAQVSRQGLRFVFFDLKGELEEGAGDSAQRRTRDNFMKLTGARYTRLLRDDLPINPLYRDGQNDTLDAQVAYEIAGLIRAYAPQLGAKQERAILDAYRTLDQPDFVTLADAMDSAGADGVAIALIKKIVDFNLFASAITSISVEEWLASSLIIDFKGFGNDGDTKSLAVALILNYLMKRLNTNLAVQNGIQPLRMVLFVDEAHLLLPKEGRAGLLASLARQGRSWGFPVWLASQDADAFITGGQHETNFAELASCGVHFSPQTLNSRQQKQILGGIVSQELKAGEATLRLGGKLQKGAARQFWRDASK